LEQLSIFLLVSSLLFIQSDSFPFGSLALEKNRGFININGNDRTMPF
jgi:hypothetical protein